MSCTEVILPSVMRMKGSSSSAVMRSALETK